jgi:hypothetical protein
MLMLMTIFDLHEYFLVQLNYAISLFCLRRRKGAEGHG